LTVFKNKEKNSIKACDPSFHW